MAIITIFGGSGFIAKNLIPQLAQEGHQLRLACRHPLRTNELKVAGAVGQIVPISVNLLDKDTIDRAIAGSDIVINLVGLLSEKGEQSFDAIHVQGASWIAELASKHKVQRVIQLSALGADINADSAYASSKAKAEKAMQAKFKEVTILRPSVIFGAQDNFINMFAKLFMISPIIPLVLGGRAKFQPIYIGDVVKAIITCLKETRTKGKTYELGGPEVLTLREILEKLRTYTGQKVGFIPLADGISNFMAFFMEIMPKPLLTRDNLKNMLVDNVVADKALGLKDLGIMATPMDLVVPEYCDIYRKGGRFSKLKA